MLNNFLIVITVTSASPEAKIEGFTPEKRVWKKIPKFP